MILNVFTIQYAIATNMIMLHIDVWLTLVHQNHFRLNKSFDNYKSAAMP